MTFLPIGSSSPGLLNSLNRSTFQINRTLNRLATGLAIRRAADNPAGLIVSENLRSQLSALEAASRNIDRAHGVLAVAETGLSEVGNLLRNLDGLVVAAANTGGMSKSERQALQLEVDSILQAINRTGASTIFAGQRQLDGSRSFVVSDVSSQISAVTVTSSNLAGGESLRVDIAVTQAAERAQVALDFSGTTVELAQPGETLVFRVRGGAGEVELNVSSGTTLEEVTATINAHTGETGVEATVEDGRVVLRSEAHGGDETVTVEIVDDGQVTGATTGIYTFVEGDPAQIDPASATSFAPNASVRDEGRDVEGTINGEQAQGDGTTLSVATSTLSASVTLETGAVGPGQANAVTVGVLYNALTVTGGPTYQISSVLGPAGRVGIGLPDISTRTLGRTGRTALGDLTSGGILNLVNGDLTAAQGVVRAAIATVATEQGRIGAFRRNTLGSAQRSIQSAFVNVSSANSMIRDTDFAVETTRLSRSFILYQASLGVLGQAFGSRWSVLNLLA